MIKKISAIFLALVLCLGVVVVPASALADGKEIEYRVELDADSYSAGDEVTVNLYVNVADGHEWGAMTFVMGVSDVFVEPGENEVGTIKDSVVANDLVMSFYKDPAGQSWAWQTNETVLTNIKNANTAEENAMYSDYLKFAFARSTAGDHQYANSQGTKNGLTADEINGEEAPAISFKLTLRDDLEDGAEIKVGITSGSITKYGFAAYYTQPGVKTTTYKVTAAESEFVVGSATIGGASEMIPLTVTHCREQIRFDKYVTGAYSGTFDYRMLATIDNFDEVIGTDYDKVTDVGFIFNKGAAIDEATAKAQVEGGAKTYSQVSNVYVSTEYKGDTYVISCLVNNIADADKTTSLSAMAYVEYVVDGVTYYAYSAVKTSNFEGLYNTYYSQAFGA